jgi:Flp pilus assembly pilin Flp
MIEYLRTSLALTADPRGLIAVEYAVIAGLLAVAVMTASDILGSSLYNAFNHVAYLL